MLIRDFERLLLERETMHELRHRSVAKIQGEEK